MRKSQIFIGSSHPGLGKLICERLAVTPAPCKISKFSNGETGCDIGVSVRDTHAIIIMGSADLINDKIMELLILVSGCRGGSASKITCVIPMFPYSKQSKMKKHRGAITARMLANLITKAGADHVITMDLHASQMQGFFSIPVDNLGAGPTLARWIKENVPEYQRAVIVSKNPGGTKRVTALADALKVNFAMIHTDRRRRSTAPIKDMYPETNSLHPDSDSDAESSLSESVTIGKLNAGSVTDSDTNSNIHIARVLKGHVVHEEDGISSASSTTPVGTTENSTGDESTSGGNGSVENDVRSPSSLGTSEINESLGGSAQALSNDDDEEVDYSEEQVIALVGDVRGRTAIILDDMIDRPDSFIAAAEHCILSCGAKSVYIVATHGVFSEGSLEALSACPYIDRIVVTNTYPIERQIPKLHVIDVSAILAECVRRNHNGESISNLFDQLAVI